MPRLIDADKIFDGKLLMVRAEAYDAVHDVIEEINNAPTVDAEPVRHGHWCFEEFPDGYYHWECSECKKWFKEDSMQIDEEWKYCPNCGAKMDEVKE